MDSTQRRAYKDPCYKPEHIGPRGSFGTHHEDGNILRFGLTVDVGLDLVFDRRPCWHTVVGIDGGNGKPLPQHHWQAKHRRLMMQKAFQLLRNVGDSSKRHDITENNTFQMRRPLTDREILLMPGRSPALILPRDTMKPTREYAPPLNKLHV